MDKDLESFMLAARRQCAEPASEPLVVKAWYVDKEALTMRPITWLEDCGCGQVACKMPYMLGVRTVKAVDWIPVPYIVNWDSIFSDAEAAAMWIEKEVEQ